MKVQITVSRRNWALNDKTVDGHNLSNSFRLQSVNAGQWSTRRLQLARLLTWRLRARSSEIIADSAENDSSLPSIHRRPVASPGRRTLFQRPNCILPCNVRAVGICGENDLRRTQIADLITIQETAKNRSEKNWRPIKTPVKRTFTSCP